MSNTIKYSEGSESLALNKGNWWIGTGDTNKGPTVESGYWNAINPPDGGYTIYLNKESNGPSIHSITSDENLISFTNKISGNNYTTVAECLVYYQTQDDKLCVNREIENIVTDGLVLNLDAGYVPSYPTSGTTWHDLSGNGNNGTLVNTPTFSSNNGGKFSFDGVDTSITTNYDFGWNDTNSVSVLVTLTPSILQNRGFIGKGSNNQWEWQLNQRNDRLELVYWNTGGSHSNGPITSIQSVFSINTTVSVGLVWNHIDGKHYFYKNGNLIGENTWVDASINQNRTNGLIIGGQIYAWNLGGNYWNGDIHNVHLYNRALSASEILQNYNAQKSRFGL